MLTCLALDQLPGLTNRVFIFPEWCKSLDHAYSGGGDLTNMMTLNVKKRITTVSSGTAEVHFDALAKEFGILRRRIRSFNDAIHVIY